nr:ankyrin repeat family protein [Tanacetum cinerariifolium]
LNDDGNTAFHFAVGRYKDNEIVREILKEKNRKLLVITVNNDGETPAHTAAVFGNTEALEMLWDTNPECLFVPDNDGSLAISYALGVSEIKTVLDLFKQMKSNKVEYDKFLRGKHVLELLGEVIEAELIDVAYELINGYLSIATATPVYEKAKTPLELIVGKTELFYSGTHYNWCQRFVYRHVPIENLETPKKEKVVTKHMWRCLQDVISRSWVKLWEKTMLHVPHIKHLKVEKVKHNTTIKLLEHICVEVDGTHKSSDGDIEPLYSSLFCLAVENNTAEAIDVLTTYFAKLYGSNKGWQNIFQLIVLNRSEKVYSYILHHERCAKSDFSVSTDNYRNNILHLAGRLAPIHKLNVASGAALQMQRELQWFEEVKKLVKPAKTRELNKANETPMMVFRKEHMGLRKDGEEWMKKTADSYTITATLIITIVFAAAITVPGGNDSATGKPIYEAKASLIIFAISDAISLFTSTT